MRKLDYVLLVLLDLFVVFGPVGAALFWWYCK